MRRLFFCACETPLLMKSIFRQHKLAEANQRLVLTNFFR